MSVRFAPSPTGRFHIGNLRTAWISHKIACLAGLPWALRFEDIDFPRVVPGAREQQLEDLARLGLVADEMVIQSQRHDRHLSLFRAAISSGRIYPCACSRREVVEALERAASAPHGPQPVYHGHCRDLAGKEVRAAFERDSGGSLAWRFRESAASGAHDFVVGRSGGPGGAGAFELQAFVPSYNWACAVDDLDGGYRLLVRAADLAQVLEQQREIQRWMLAVGEARGARGAASALPAVFHCALVTADDGTRLEKRTRGVTLPELEARGISPARLAELFAASFETPRDLDATGALLSPGSIGAEPRETMTLSQLGL